jgi:PAS domain S-box-containing protein
MQPDGKIRWIFARGLASFNPMGSADRLMGASVDVTMRKEAETALAESEARYRLLAENVSDVIWTMDFGGHLTYVSPSVTELCGFTVEEVIAQSVDELLTESSARQVHEAFEYIEAHGRQDQLDSQWELEQVRKDGSTVWTEASAKILRDGEGNPLQIVGVSRDITKRRSIEQQLREHLAEIEELKHRLEKENIFLKEEMHHQATHDIVGQSMAMKKVLIQAEQVAQTDSTVLIMGETGTGKELLARAIHRMSRRKEHPLVTVNCASLPPTLIESELFGREKGAYTGAMTKMIGRFEVADGSTLFLDEVGELSVELQAKLLRVLEEKVFERLGSTRPIKVNIRLIAATNRDLADDVKTGRFRKDLYYRLNVFPITIPPLRDRLEDVPPMVWSFVNEFQERMGKRIEMISKKSMEEMKMHAWPGNVRELRNVIERAMITTRGESLTVTLPWTGSLDTIAEQSLQDVERRHILEVLERTHWRVTGKRSAAEILGLKRSTLQSKMKKLSIKRPSN